MEALVDNLSPSPSAIDTPDHSAEIGQIKQDSVPNSCTSERAFSGDLAETQLQESAHMSCFRINRRPSWGRKRVRDHR
jgi:hypothetical protein